MEETLVWWSSLRNGHIPQLDHLLGGCNLYWGLWCWLFWEWEGGLECGWESSLKPCQVNLHVSFLFVFFPSKEGSLDSNTVLGFGTFKDVTSRGVFLCSFTFIQGFESSGIFFTSATREEFPTLCPSSSWFCKDEMEIDWPTSWDGKLAF